MKLLPWIGVLHILVLPSYSYNVKCVTKTSDELEQSGYRAYVIPKNPITNDTSTFNPLIVYVNMYIYSFNSISVVNMDYTLDLILRQRWMDKGLLPIAWKNNSRVTISRLKDVIWTPDLFFRNAKEGFVHGTTQPNYLIWLDPEGIVTFSQKLSMKVSCHMNLWNFPMDTQICRTDFGSYGYATNELAFRWWLNDKYIAHYIPPDDKKYTKAVEIRKDLEINEFSLVSHEAFYCSAAYKKTGNFSCLMVEFRLKRLFGFYLIYAYLPSVLIVIIAWVSFLLDPASAPARVSIGLMCVLALITQSAAILTQLPRVSYVKAIDIWLFACLAFVVSSLLEFAAANSIARHKAYRNNKARKMYTKSNRLNGRVKSDGDMFTKAHYKTHSVRSPMEANDLDSICDNMIDSKYDVNSLSSNKVVTIQDNISLATRKLDLTFAIGYPIVFLIFNCIYWSYFLL